MNSMTGANPMMAAALRYARRGWHVFPIRVDTKGRDRNGRSTHYLPNGHKDASSDPDRVRHWWSRWPDANIGLNLAASGLVALDPDLYKPDCAWETFMRDRDLPPTLVQRSPRGGKHFLFRADTGVRYPGTLCPGVDIKHQGYILLEPSTFEGAAYRFETDHEPAPVPGWVDESGGKSATTASRVEAGTHGNVPAAGTDATVTEVEDLLSYIDPDAEGYAAWIEVLQALHDHFRGGPEGLALAEAWSRRGGKYRDGEVATRWTGFRSGGGVTIRTLAARARSNGADLGEIARRHRQERPAEPVSDPVSDPVSSDPPDLSHDGLALDLGSRSWDRDARFVATWDSWLFWTGTHWQRDETLAHLTRARAYLRTRASNLITWAEHKATAEHAQDAGKADKVRNWARDQSKVLRSSATVAAVSGLARANASSATTQQAFDADRYVVGTPGGTVDLRTGVLRPARREDMISRLTSCAPADPGTRPTLWLRFLSEAFDGDHETVAFLQRAAGYALSGATSEHKLLFLHGSGRNGKSVFLNTLLEIWGGYGRRVAATTFLNSQTERHPTDIAGLQGARLAVASELPRGKTWDEAIIKDLTGGDRMTARYMRQDFFDFDPQLTLMIAGNTQPSFRGVDEAIRSRVVLVPFTVTVPPERRDRALPEKLKREAPAILRWCIDGALAWQERGLDVPASIAAASADYFDEEDTLGQFLQDETIADPHAFTASEDLISRFNQWSERQGLGPWTQRSLVKELKARGFSDGRNMRQRGLGGLRLRTR